MEEVKKNEEEVKKNIDIEIKITPYNALTIIVNMHVKVGMFQETFETEKLIRFQIDNGYAVFNDSKIPLEKLAEYIDAQIQKIVQELENDAKDLITIFKQYNLLAKKYNNIRVVY